MNIHGNLVKQAIVYYFQYKKVMKVPKALPDALIAHRAGVFVSLHTKNGELRGCIGTLVPTKANTAEEIIYNALSAAFDDDRFLPLKEGELNSLKISVDVLSEPEPINSINQLNVKKYGVIVRTEDGRSGVLLPDLDAIDSVEKQVLIACQKGGINPINDKIFLYRFTVERHK